MKNIDVVQILICILSSSFLSVIVSAIFLDPIRERRKYIFDEKKRSVNLQSKLGVRTFFWTA